MKRKTGKTAWERKQLCEFSYLEEWFFDECIIKNNLEKQYDIVNEYCEFPYFIDFAFLNIKVAVELDGKCHFIHGEKRKDHDKIKDEHLIKNGWKIFRICYNENNVKTINEFLAYISEIKAGKKILENRTYKYKEIKNRKNRKKRTFKKYLEDKRIKNFEKNKPLIEKIKNSNINFSKFGWVKKVAEIIGKKSQKVNCWMKIYMNDFYEEKCFKRKNGSPKR